MSGKPCLQISTSSDGLRCHPPMNLLNHRQLFPGTKAAEVYGGVGRGLVWGGEDELMDRGSGLGVDIEAALCSADAFQATFPGTSGPSALHGVCSSLLSEHVP